MNRRPGERFGAWSFVLPALLLFLLLATCPVVSDNQTETVTQGDFEVGFSPQGRALDIVLGAINGAQSSILVAAYSFTSKPIATALLEAHKRGVDVRVTADARSNAGRYSATTFLANQGVPVRINSRYAIFHHKFMVIDGKHVETGSFNYSAAAAKKNAENVLVLRDAPEIAKLYSGEWERLWQEGEAMRPKY